MEEALYQPDGTLIAANFLDYALPGRGIPVAIQPVLVRLRAPVMGNNLEGFKGVGVDAWLGTLPVTPTRLYDLLARRTR
jgi:hypothetical protein